MATPEQPEPVASWPVSVPSGPCASCDDRQRLGRRRFLGALWAGLGLTLVGAGSAGAARRPGRGHPRPRPNGTHLEEAPQAQIVTDPGSGAPVALGSIPPAKPGAPQMFFGGPKGTQQIAITLDDGYCASCISAYVDFARSSGMHLTFNPNGQFGSLWDPHVDVVREMIAEKQVQIGNHTFSHPNLLQLSSSGVTDELNRNEEWIEKTFGVTGRPWFRPPYGYYNERVNDLAGTLGYTNILMWDGSFGDSTVISPQQLMGLANQYLTPGTIMLGHLNHDVIFPLWPQIQQIIAQRNLDPVTLDEMFGTSRASG